MINEVEIPELPDGVRAIITPWHNGYAVATDGTVWSRRGKGRHALCIGKRWRRLKPYSDRGGYLWVRFGIRSSFLVHRVVLESFIGPRPPGNEVCHNNGIKTDNSLSNLRYDTKANNERDKQLHGRTLKGEANPRARLTELQVIEIRRRASDGETRASLARVFCVPSSAISNICSRKLWKHVT